MLAIRSIAILLLLSLGAAAQKLADDDAVRIAEFYRLAAQVQDKVWPNWSAIPAPLLLVAKDTEFLTHHPTPPKEFTKVSPDAYSRARQFDPSLLATFPAFGPPSVIVIGQPQNTQAKTSTPWLIVVMHEHFHQLQNAQPGYFDAVNQLGLSRGDNTGMWMLNYPFPYEKAELVRGFGHLRDLLLDALGSTDENEFHKKAAEYIKERKRVLAQLSDDDHKYLSFQLWQEGIARYTQIKVAEEATKYEPTARFATLADYEPFSAHGAKARAETLHELQQADLAGMKRVFVYPFGAAEGLLLDRWNPRWKNEYFRHMLSTDALFETGVPTGQ